MEDLGVGHLIWQDKRVHGVTAWWWWSGCEIRLRSYEKVIKFEEQEEVEGRSGADLKKVTP